MTFASGAHALDRRAELLFTLLGAAMLGAYGLLWLDPLRLDRFEPFAGDARYIGSILGYTYFDLARFTVAFAVPTLLYVAAFALLPQLRRHVALSVVVTVTILAPLILVYTYPALAADPFGSLMYGRIITEYGANPYVDPTSAYPNDVYYPPTGIEWRELRAVYGPVWIWLSAFATAVAGDDPLPALIMLKLLVILSHLGTATFVYLIAREIAPRQALRALLAYGWNPLAITHFALDAHNDATMLLFLTAALWLAVRRRWELAFPALTLAALVKIVPVLLGPLFLLAARRDPRRALVGVGLALLVAALVYAPLWAGQATFTGLREQTGLMTSSPATLLSYVMRDDWLRPLSLAVFGIGYLAILWVIRPASAGSPLGYLFIWKHEGRLGSERATPDQAQDRSLLARSFGVLVLYYWTLSFWTKGWYFTWAVALGAVLGGPALLGAVLASIGVFLQNVSAWYWEMNWWGWRDEYGKGVWEVWLTGALYLPWVVAAVWAVIRNWRRALRSGNREQVTGNRLQVTGYREQR